MFSIFSIVIKNLKDSNKKIRERVEESTYIVRESTIFFPSLVSDLTMSLGYWIIKNRAYNRKSRYKIVSKKYTAPINIVKSAIELTYNTSNLFYSKVLFDRLNDRRKLQKRSETSTKLFLNI
jgi:hypothetical protein